MGLRYHQSCINTIRRDFPYAFLDLSGVNFEAMYGAYIISYGVFDPVDSFEESEGDGDEDFGLKVNLGMTKSDHDIGRWSCYFFLCFILFYALVMLIII